MDNPFVDDHIRNDERFSSDGQFGLPLEEILDFSNPVSGFYIETHYGAVFGENEVPPWELVYISKKKWMVLK